MKNQFLQNLTEKINENISDEQFGVSELAREIGMSRSNLLRKVKKLTGLSVSRFIREIRLNFALELLHENELTVSEISFKAGFNSTSYFIKCFREKFGFPPGETHKHQFTGNSPAGKAITKKVSKNYRWLLTSATILILLLVVLFEIIIPRAVKKSTQKKSIAVLPFINDSNDSTNIYIVNGLMESILNNLQKIEGFRVISRTSVEKYRNSSKTIPEIAKELNVAYLVEGSGQKMGNEVVLNIQLIEGSNDRHLWAQQYKRNSNDIFSLQNEVAQNIASEVKVILSPEEEIQLNKIPTENALAYDYFLRGLDLLQKGTIESAADAIPYFHNAIQNDTHFARAYAALAISYFTFEDNNTTKNFTDSINFYADKALLIDPQLPQSLIAKGLYFMSCREYSQAVPYFEKTLEIHPNNDLVLIFLVDLYANHLPDTEKYLQYTLMGQKLDITAYDSTVQSYNYLHLSNAFIQAGFEDEALEYIDKSLEYFPGNIYSDYVKAYILYTKNRDLETTLDMLLTTFQKDTSRLDVMQEVAKIYYYQRNYKLSYSYYMPFYATRKAYNLDIYRGENIKIGKVFLEMNMKNEARQVLEDFKRLADNDQTVYKDMYYAQYFALENDFEQTIECLTRFSSQPNFHYWTVLFTPIDPVFEKISDRKEFKLVMKKIENNFRKYHYEIRKSLKEKDLL